MKKDPRFNKLDILIEKITKLIGTGDFFLEIRDGKIIYTSAILEVKDE